MRAESRVRNALVIVAALTTLLMILVRFWWLVAAGLVVTALAVIAAAHWSAPRFLMRTDHPELYRPGTLWRGWQITARVRDGDRWRVYGKRTDGI